MRAKSLSTILGIVLLAQFARGEAGVTNVSQLRSLSSQTPTNAFHFDLQGDVWWANPATGDLVLKDASGAEELELDWQGTAIGAGQRLSIEGDATLVRTGNAFKIGAKGPVVDDDGVHVMTEKSGAVFLRAGRNPLRLEWFNGEHGFGLEVDWEGPDLSRGKILDSALFRADGGAGLDYKCVEAPGEILPDFSSAKELASGAVNNFDLRVMARPEHVGLAFIGFLDVPRDGLYLFHSTSDDGSRLYVGRPTLRLAVTGPAAAFPQARPFVIGENAGEGQWAAVEGKVTFASESPDGLHLELSARTGRIRVELPPGSGLTASMLLNHTVRATGFCQSATTIDGMQTLAVLLSPGRDQIECKESPAEPAPSTSLPLLVNAADIHRLKREEAQRGYPVKIQGVVTCVLPERQAFTIQDATRGIYVADLSESRSEPPRIGEFLEVEGTTDPSFFAPVVNARHVELRGAGDLPEPVHPTRDQLMNGSLDAQYVEVQGILTSVQDDSVTLLTPDGRLKSELRAPGLTTRDLARYEDALIRVRGCLLATWDYVTHQVKVDEVRIYGAAITVEQPAPADLFAIPRKTASDLLLFDPQAGAFQRVKVSGQIIHRQDAEFFLMDGSNGVRFIAKHPGDLQAGDLVDVVGFPELGSAAPVLREAVVRKTGHAPLAPARAIGADDLIQPGLDSTRVRVKALLVNQRGTPTGQALEMRAGLRSFLATLPGPADSDVHAIPAGSQLELTGTCVIQGLSQNVASFGLLLDTPADIAVLARPPWWTLQRLLFILGALACVLAGTVLWITQLRRKVEQRSAELETQIRERQRAEQQHAMELERARIAQDLHDELGSGLTEISMLGVRAQANSAPLEKRGHYVEQMSSQARQMVTTLDEIVWAMNPTHDSLDSLVSYFSLYAERFLGLANIAWRLEAPFKADHHVVDSRHRHQLFLAFKEALTNIVRHSGATEVLLDFQLDHGRLCVAIADNGRGWAGNGATAEMDGIANMRARLEKLNGRFDVQTRTGQGTVVRFDLPLQ